jgi:hypothetical protein
LLSWIRVDHQSRLQFGQAELVIENAFTLRVAGAVHQLDPDERSALGPLLALYPDTMALLAMSPDGTLRGTFASGSSLTIPPHPYYEAWGLCGF